MKSLDIHILQWFQTAHPSPLDDVVLVLTNGLTWIPLYLIIFYILHRRCPSRSQLLLAVGFGVLCVALVASFNNLLMKPLVGRLRPCADPALAGFVGIVGDSCARNFSFFSSHAANTSSVAVFFSLVVRHRWFTVCMLSWSLLNCYTRLYLAQHFPSDILCGLAFGSLMAWLFYRIYCICIAKYSHNEIKRNEYKRNQDQRL